MGFESNVMIYNKRILDEKGLPVPKTTSELLETARALQKHNGENSYGVALRGELGWGTIILLIRVCIRCGGPLTLKWRVTSLSQSKQPGSCGNDRLVCKTDPGGRKSYMGKCDLVFLRWGIRCRNSSHYAGCHQQRVFPDNPRKCGRSREFGDCSHSSAGRQDRCRYKITALDLVPGNEQRICPQGCRMAVLTVFSGKEYQNESSVSAKIVNTPRQSSYDQDAYQELLKNSEGFVETFDATVDYTRMYYTPETYFFEVSQTGARHYRSWWKVNTRPHRREWTS